MVNSIHLLKNPIMQYAWGSHTALAELTGRPAPSVQPEAELWMGAHPKAPSTVIVDGGGDTSLLKLIDAHPVDILGQETAAAYGNRLPYLFKVLAIEKALSIQAHPDLSQARDGFQRENRRQLALDAPERNYRDGNHKPELICALTPFWALNGFRAAAEMETYLRQGCGPPLESALENLSGAPVVGGLKGLVGRLLNMGAKEICAILDAVVGYARERQPGDPVFDWVIRLHDMFPGDIGALFPCILNLVRLEPGQAMYLPAGQLHAYLGGVGVELMANSDNVLRGGLTSKHVDVPELLQVVVFEEQPLKTLFPREKSPCEKVYATPAEEFELSVIHPSDGCVYRSGGKRSAEILLATDGRVAVFDDTKDTTIELVRGMAAIVPASVDRYSISGRGTVYRAGVGAL
ncbi:MAG: mannose-6-phosphate isomerase, class I [Deltaproteobacteria bacterium]|nr:mannose-6-phosphate isomerase, class I [Deltaproteobacteria bacterium]